MPKVNSARSDHRDQTNQERGCDAAKVCRPHQRLEQECEESIDSGIDQDVAARKRRAAETSRDDAHHFRRRTRALHGAFDRRRDAAGAPGEELEHRLDRKPESEPKKRQHWRDDPRLWWKPWPRDDLHEPIEPRRVDALQRARHFYVQRMATIALDESEQTGKEGERGQPENHRASSAREGPAWGEHLAHCETTGGRLGEDGRRANAGWRGLRLRQRR